MPGLTTRSDVVLATARLRLRPCSEGDVDALHALWTDPQVRRFLWDDVVIERATAAERVAASEASFATARFGLWMIEPREGGAPLGAIGLVELDASVGPEILYALHPHHQGRGHACEASRTLLDYAFEVLGMPRVFGRTDTPNRASARVLERIGMRFEGERLVAGRPTLCYAITRDAWRAAPRPLPR